MNKKQGVGYASVTDLEKKYVLDALDSQRLSQGKFVARFEREFSRMHDNRYGVMCNSGTSALTLAIETLKETENWGPETEILVPAITFIATSNAVIHAGLKVVFVDVDPLTYNMDPNDLLRRISKNTKCIIPVHAFGMPCEMQKIMEIAKEYNLKVIEDCAESHFAKIDGKVIGSFGDLSCFSTYVAHTITTGVGGIVCTNNREYMEILRSLLAHGRACTCEVCIASDSMVVCPKRLTTEIDRRFMFVRIGYSFRVGELEGALGLAQIERKDEIMGARHSNAQQLINGLAKYENSIQLPRHRDNVEHTYMMFPIVIKDPNINRKVFTDFLEKNNVETRPMLPLLNQPIYKQLFGNIEDDYPVTKYIDSHGFYIGCHHGMNEQDINYILKVFDSFFESIKG